MEALEDISVKVPKDRIPEFYAMVSRWLAHPPATKRATAQRSTVALPLHDWTAHDLVLAQKVWSKLSDKAKRLFALLMATPGREFTGSEIAESLNLPHGRFGTAGTLAWPGRHSYAVGRNHPIGFKEGEGDSIYWMTNEVAALFRKASKA